MVGPWFAEPTSVYKKQPINAQTLATIAKLIRTVRGPSTLNAPWFAEPTSVQKKQPNNAQANLTIAKLMMTVTLIVHANP